MKTILTIAAIMFFATPAMAENPKSNVKFYDFGDQVINGELKAPTVTYIDNDQRVKFDRLLSLKKTFLPALEETGKESTFK